MFKRRVSIIVFFNGKKILIQDRRKISKLGEEFGIFGGGIENKESPEEALKREIKEELGIEVRNYKLFRHDVVFVEEMNGEVERFIYLAPVPDEKFIAKEGDVKVVSIEGALKLKMLKKDIQLLKEIGEYLNLS